MQFDASEPVVRCETRGKVLLVTIDHPPVNALNARVRRALFDAIEGARADSDIDAILLVGAGRHFIAGADIHEFGQPALPPTLPDLCALIEACDKLVITAIHGAALGGGLEIALSAHYRLAMPDAKLGFPEVQLGLLPGAGGTQRTPRLIGMKAALDLILSGRHIDANTAYQLGLIDYVGNGDDEVAEGLAYARRLLDDKAPVRRTCHARALEAERSAHVAAIAAARVEIAKTARGLFSPSNIIDALEAALDQPFDEGLRVERKRFLACVNSPQRAGLVHAFFAEREVLKAPETRAARARPINAIGVVGAGTMGVGIAVAALDAKLAVTLIERDEAALSCAGAKIEKIYDDLIAKGRMSADAKAQALARCHGSTAYEALADVDLVIEAVFEDTAAKRAVFTELDRVCKAGAVLATNTSYLDIHAITNHISRSADVIGLHFFSPANVMKLLEVVAPNGVNADVVATAFEFAKKLRKIPVRAGVCDGFIGNRMLAAYRTAADYMMEDGASPYQIDQAVRDFGFPMGPFQVIDLAGGDIGWAARKRRAAMRDPNARYVHISDRLCERGWFGQKAGRGFYLYAQGERQGQPDPEVEAIIEAERQRAGITPRTFTNEEIIRRYLAAMINEGANVIEERIALRPLDVDVTLIYGYGFPRYRGGPMKYADMMGVRNILDDIRTFEKEAPLFWRASPLLVKRVEQGADFASLNG